MSVYVMGLVWEHYPAGGSEKLVALALADEAGHDGSDIYPSIARLAQRCNMSTRGVQKLLRKIEARDFGGVPWFILENGSAGGRKVTRRYRCPRAALEKAFHKAAACDESVPEATTNDVRPSGEERANDVHPLKDEQYSPFSEKGRTDVRKRVNPSSPDPLIPVPTPARTRVSGQRFEMTFGCWQPDDMTHAGLKRSGAPMPSDDDVAQFVAHYNGRWLTPEQADGQFVRWMIREKQYRAERATKGERNGPIHSGRQPQVASRSIHAWADAAQQWLEEDD